MTSSPEFNKETNGTDAAKALSSQIRGRTVLITGASPNGLGQATAHALLVGEPSVIIISGRSQAKLDQVVGQLRAVAPSVSVRTLVMDLASQKSVRAGAAEVNAYSENIDVLINNAGVMAVQKRTLTEEGIEMQFGTNHIGHFLFTNLILGKQQAATDSGKPGATRIINLTSYGHVYSPVRFSDYNFEGEGLSVDETPDWELLNARGRKDPPTNGYSPWVGYGQAKTANILFSVYLKKHLSKRGILSFAVHPGTIRTELMQNLSEQQLQDLQGVLQKMTLKTHDQGVSTSIVAAYDPNLNESSGPYLNDCQVGEPRGWASDEAKAEKLWALSEQLVGQKFSL